MEKGGIKSIIHNIYLELVPVVPHWRKAKCPCHVIQAVVQLSTVNTVVRVFYYISECCQIPSALYSRRNLGMRKEAAVQ